MELSLVNNHRLQLRRFNLSMSITHPILFWDIASGPPKCTYAPNPWKTRYVKCPSSSPFHFP